MKPPMAAIEARIIAIGVAGCFLGASPGLASCSTTEGANERAEEAKGGMIGDPTRELAGESLPTGETVAVTFSVCFLLKRPMVGG
jgi:hypothetical protein